MLVKCVCNNCGHSYLADDNAGQLECPRCGVGNDGVRNASDIPAPPAPGPGPEPAYNDHQYHDDGYDDGEYYDDYGYDVEEQFDPQTPPPTVLSGQSFFKGLLVGALAALVMGAVLGGALAAIRVSIPLVAPLVMALVVGAACRYGFGGRASARTRVLAMVVVFLAVVVGTAGNIAGAWMVERLTGSRAVQAREDISRGIDALERRASMNQDAGTGIVLDKRLRDARQLQAMSDAELEDYLWKQQAQINQPLIAYGKLRVLQGPVLQFGPDSDPIDVPKEAILGILLAEILAAAWLAHRGVKP